MKKIFKSLIISLVCLFVTTSSSFAMKFNDVEEGYWAYAAIDAVGDLMYADGYPEGEFKPENFVTRAEYATMIVKALNQVDTPVDQMRFFEDVPYTHWAYKYVIKAADLDIFQTLDEHYFYPEEYVPRTEIITFLVNILKSEEISRKEASDVLSKRYLDYQDIPDWFKLTAGKAAVLDVIAQEPERRDFLDCNDNITRAEMATFLYYLKREVNEYLQERIEKETSPTIVEDGINIENVIRDGDVVTLPIKTVLPIVVSGQISSDDSTPSDMFKARFANNLTDSDNNLIFSRDLILIGKILDTTRSKNFVRNGQILFELSAVNNKKIFTRIMGYAECQEVLAEGNKFKKFVKTIIKGRNFVLKDGQVVYVRLYQPIRVNLVTGEVFK